MDIWQFKIVTNSSSTTDTLGPHEYKKEWILQFEGVQLEFKQMTLKL